MAKAFDCTRCSLRELEDVAQRIDRKRYPERYAQVVAEIEKRQRDAAAEVAEPKARSGAQILMFWIKVEASVLVGFGIVWPIAIYNSPFSPQTDMPMGLLLVPLTVALLLLCACDFGILRYFSRSENNGELALENALKAVLCAPFSLPLALIADFVFQFEMPILRVLIYLSSFSAPFLIAYGVTRKSGN